MLRVQADGSDERNCQRSAQVDFAGCRRTAGRGRLCLWQDGACAAGRRYRQGFHRGAHRRRHRLCAERPAHRRLPATTACRCIGWRWRASRSIWNGRAPIPASPSRPTVASSSPSMQENALHGWKLDTKPGAETRHMRMTGYPAKVKSVSWSAKGKWLASSGAPAAIVWPFQAKDGPMGKAPLELGTRANIMVTAGLLPSGRGDRGDRLCRRHDPRSCASPTARKCCCAAPARARSPRWPGARTAGSSPSARKQAIAAWSISRADTGSATLGGRLDDSETCRAKAAAMLFKNDVLAGIAKGDVTLAFRRWQKPTVRAGGTLRTTVGVLVHRCNRRRGHGRSYHRGCRSVRPFVARRAACRYQRATRRHSLSASPFHLAGGDPETDMRDRHATLNQPNAKTCGALDRLRRQTSPGHSRRCG